MSEKQANLVYSALFLHSAGKPVDEDNLGKLVKSVGVTVDDAQIKALVAALKGVNIDEAVKQSVVAAPAASAPSAGEKKAEAKEEKKEEEKKEEAAAGLSGLFG